jgi:transposase
MTIVHCELGMDVGKNLVVVRKILEGRRQDRSFSNDPEGMDHLKKWLEGYGGVASVEASGGYERLLVRTMQGGAWRVDVHNPRRIRRLAQGLGIEAKTDPLDAGVLAVASRVSQPAPPKSEDQETLADISRTIEQLTRDRSDNLKRLRRSWISPEVREALERVCASMTESIRLLEKEFRAKLRASRFKERSKLAQTVPSVGPVLARVLVSELPEDLSRFTPKQVCSYCGVAPMDDSSGKRHGRKHVRGGNKRVKAALYMPAINAIQRQDWAAKLYSGLLAKGKTHQEAIVAVMRRLLLRVLSVLNRGSAWQTEPPLRT